MSINGSFEVCFNHLSLMSSILPIDLAKEHLYYAICGLYKVYNQFYTESESACIYFSELNPQATYQVTDNYSLESFLEDLKDLDPDLYDFFMTLSTQAPENKQLISKKLQHRGFVAEGYGDKSVGILFFALTIDAYVLSLPNPPWGKDHIQCYLNDQGSETKGQLKNINCAKPGWLVDIVPIAVERKFTQGTWSICINFNDHPPPHVHSRSPNGRCLLTIESKPKKLAGHTASGEFYDITTYINKKHQTLLETWNKIHPKKH